jgi:hypothetical protein
VNVDGQIISTSTTYYVDPDMTVEQNLKAAEETGAEFMKEVEAEYWAAKDEKEITFGKNTKEYGWSVVCDCPNVKRIRVPKGSQYDASEFDGIKVEEY